MNSRQNFNELDKDKNKHTFTFFTYYILLKPEPPRGALVQLLQGNT